MPQIPVLMAQMSVDQIYEEGRRLFLAGKFERALDQFKLVYESDFSFRDVAEIVEDSYLIPKGEWRKKYRTKFSRT